MDVNNEEVYKLMRICCLTNQKDKFESIIQENEGLDLNISNDKGYTFLHLACASKNVDIAKLLLDRNADMKLQDKNGNTPLHLACANGYLDMVELLTSEASKRFLDNNCRTRGKKSMKLKKLDKMMKIIPIRKNSELLNKKNRMEKKSYINLENKDGNTPLHLACKNDYKDIVMILLNNGAKLDVANAKRITPLGLACIDENMQMINLLIGKMSNRKIKEEFDYACEYNNKRKAKAILDSKANEIVKEIMSRCLFVACAKGNIDIVDLLIEYEVDVNEKDEIGRTPIFLTQDKDILLKLIKSGANPNIKDKGKSTPLFYNCLLESSDDIIRMLLENGADANGTNGTKGITALYAACENRKTNIIKILLEHKANIYEKGYKGDTAIHACCKGFEGDALQCVLNYYEGINEDINVNLRNDIGATPLHLACLTENEDCVKMLINKNANVNLRTKLEKKTPLHLAAIRGNKKIVQLLLDSGSKVNEKDAEKMTPLHYACTMRFDDIVDILIRRGADVDAKSKKSVTPLQCACYALDKKIVEMLLRVSADVTSVNDLGEDALQIVCDRDNKEIESILKVEILFRAQSAFELGDEVLVRKLLFSKKIEISEGVLNCFLNIACNSNNEEMMRIAIEKGANVNKMVYGRGYIVKKSSDFNIWKGENPIHIACDRGYLDIVKMLIENGADITVKDDLGYTPVELALDNGHTDVAEVLYEELFRELVKASKTKDVDIEKIETLVKQCKDINLEDEFGNTPIVYACQNGRLDVMEHFLKSGINIKEDKHTKDMLIAACSNENCDVLKCLIEEGANVDILDKDKRTLLMLACKNGKVNIVKYLAQIDNNLNYQDKFGKTAIMIACESNNLDIVKCLVEKKVDVNYKDVYNKAAVEYAIESEAQAIVKYLVEHNANVNYKDKEGRTLLMKACKSENLSLVKALDIKYIINVSDKKGETALMCACWLGCKDIVMYLIKKGARITTRDVLGNNALAYACMFGHKDIVQSLVIHAKEKNMIFSINNKNKNGVTPLMYACDMFQAYYDTNKECDNLELQGKRDQIAIIKLLVENGAVVNEDVIRYASKNKNTSIYKYLKKKYNNEIPREIYNRGMVSERKMRHKF